MKVKKISQRRSEVYRRTFIDGHRESFMALNMSPRNSHFVNDIFESLLDNDYGKAERLCIQETYGSEKLISLALLGLTYFLMCSPGAAAEVVDEALEINPDFFPALNIAGDVLYQQKIFDRAEEALTRSVQLKGSQKHPRIFLAELYNITGRQEEALAVLDGLRRDFPDNAVVWSKICQIHDNRGTIKIAEQMLRTELQRSDDNFGAWYNLGVIYHDLFRLDDAEKALLKAQEIYSGDTNTILTLGKVYKLSAQNEKAVQTFQMVLETDPDDSEALFELAGILYFQGELDEARALYQRAEELDPSVAERSMFYFLGDGLRMGPLSGTVED
jgi:tetratricopeptide (TPR) repeat protein